MSHDLLDRPVLTDAVITPQMIEAGVGVLISCPGSLEIRADFEPLVENIFRAMWQMSPTAKGRP